MKITIKAAAALLVAVLLAMAGGWLWGAAGRWQSDEALGRSGTRLHLAHARGQLLQARIDLFELNFGRATRSLESAHADLSTAAQAYERTGRPELGRKIRDAMARADEARQLAGRLDQAANGRVADAITLLPEVP